MNKLLTVKEVASWLKVSPSTVNRLVVRGEMPHFKVGEGYRMDLDVLVYCVRVFGGFGKYSSAKPRGVQSRAGRSILRNKRQLD
jgi:excisionase family DNA binding protein